MGNTILATVERLLRSMSSRRLVRLGAGIGRRDCVRRGGTPLGGCDDPALGDPRGRRSGFSGPCWAFTRRRCPWSSAAGFMGCSRFAAPRRRDKGALLRALRWALLASSCVLGLFMMEAASAAWVRWQYRIAELPTRSAERSRSPSGTADAGDDLYLVVVGESSARGELYYPWLSVGQIVGWQLEQVFPRRRIKVDVRRERALPAASCPVAQGPDGQARWNSRAALPEESPGLARVDACSSHRSRRLHRHFELDAAKWSTICERSASFYDRTAYVRFDPSERLNVAARFDQATRDLAAGRPLRAASPPSPTLAVPTLGPATISPPRSKPTVRP